MNPKFLLIIAALCNSTGMLLLRYGGKEIVFTHGVLFALKTGYLWIIGMGFGWISGLLFAYSMTKIELSVAVSLFVSLTYVLAFLGGIIFLKEQSSLLKLFGCVCVIFGLYVLVR